MRKLFFITVLAALIVLVTAGAAMAAHTDKGDRTGWDEMYYGNPNKPSGDCDMCHTGLAKHTRGPHGGYSSTTNKCQACHTVHKASSSSSLLPGATVTAACQFCHDLTATTEGPYSAYGLTNPKYGEDIKGSHRVFGTIGSTVYNDEGTYGLTSIPGGDDATGDVAVLNTADQGDLSGDSFTCNSCHTPHALADATVDAYLGESPVKITTQSGFKMYATNRILKNRVNGVDVSNNKYGSAWCIACHQGRDNSHAGVFNHPVNEDGLAYDILNNLPLGVTYSGPFNTKDLIANPGDVVNNAVYYSFTGGDPRSNKWFTMEPDDPLTGIPRPDGAVDYAAFAAAGGPSCQQCHGNVRDVEVAFAAQEGNMRFTFPHISTTPYLLTGSGDDFCTNCHGTSNLP